MGFLDNARKSLTKVVDQHGATIEKGADKLGDAINQRTGNKHADKLAKGREQLRRGMDGLDARSGEPEGRVDGPATPPVSPPVTPPADRRDDPLR
jgi:hypothetical protein